MTRTVTEQTAGGVTLAGSGSWTSAVADGAASGGSYGINVSVGATASYLANSGATCVIPGVLMYHNGCSNVSVYLNVNGGGDVLQYTYDCNTHVTAGVTSAAYWFYRATLPPVFMTPGANNVVKLAHNGTGGQGLAVDFFEYWVAEAIVAGQMTVWGHSWPRGFGLAAPATQRFGAISCNLLGMTEDNQGVDNNDLTNGTNSAVAVNDVWTVSTGTGSSAGTVTISVTAGGSTQTTGNLNWNASAATVLTAVQGLSNVGVGQIAVGGTALNVGAGLTLTFQGTLAAITLMVNATTTGTLTGGALVLTHTTSGQGVNPQSSSEANAQPAWMQAETNVGIGLTWARKSPLFVLMHGTNDHSVWLANDATCGAGWSRRRFTQRLKEVAWRVMANVNTLSAKNVEIWALLQPPPLSVDNATWWAVYQDMNAGIVAAMNDSTIKGHVVESAGLLGVASGGATRYTSDHPNVEGHAILANAFIQAYRQSHPEKYGPVAYGVR